MLQVSKKFADKFRRLNTIMSAEDALANHVLYHNQCWVIAKRKAKHTLSETELINFA